jgi:hypothetical protein
MTSLSAENCIFLQKERAVALMCVVEQLQLVFTADWLPHARPERTNMIDLHTTNNVGRGVKAAIFAWICLSTQPLPAQVIKRPLSDFLDAQGSTTCFTPPARAQLGWGTGLNKTNGVANLTPPRFALIDYTGLEGKYLKDNGFDVGTTVSGTVSERPLADGRALVTVDLHTKNALGWALQDQNDFNTDPPVFGSRVSDVRSGKPPALGDAHFNAVFANTAPGAPLPDLVCIQAAFCSDLKPCPTGFELENMSIQASITGLLHAPALPDPVSWPEGAAGRLAVQQLILIHAAAQNGGSGPLSDASPVEAIDLKPIGH